MKELKKDSATSHIPVIVLTGLSQKNETKLRKGWRSRDMEKSSIDFEKNADTLLQPIANVLGTGEYLT